MLSSLTQASNYRSLGERNYPLQGCLQEDKMKENVLGFLADLDAAYRTDKYCLYCAIPTVEVANSFYPLTYGWTKQEQVFTTKDLFDKLLVRHKIEFSDFFKAAAIVLSDKEQPETEESLRESWTSDGLAYDPFVSRGCMSRETVISILEML